MRSRAPAARPALSPSLLDAMRKSMVVMAVMGVLVAGCGSEDSPPSASTAAPEPAGHPHRGHRRAVREGTLARRARVLRRRRGARFPGHRRRGRVPPAAATGHGRDRRHDHADRHQHRRPAAHHGDRPHGPGHGGPPAARGDALRRRRPGAREHRHRHPRQRPRERAPALRPAGRRRRCSASRRTARTASTGTVRIEVGEKASGCLLFQVPEIAEPRELLFALETVPAEAGGRWRLR